MRLGAVFLLAIGCSIVAVTVAGRADLRDPEWMTQARPGGEATTDVQSRVAFTQHVPNLTPDELSEFATGNRIFGTPWVEAPASVQLFDGLGPFFSKRSCSGCHVRDGRGRPPDGPQQITESMIVKLGRVGDPHPVPDPVYGSQLSERAVQGITPEGRLAVRWTERPHRYPDGRRASLRWPRFEIAEAAYGPIGGGTLLSPRIAPALIGVGLLEAVPDSALAALADPDDANGDGISGRVHWVQAAPRMAGRFGWKSTQPTVEAQVAAALAGDIGITTPARRQLELSGPQHAAAARPSGGDPELEGRPLAALVNYCRMLSVPARRDPEHPAIRRGARRFLAAGCAGCHTPALSNGDARPAALSRQTIHPFSDLLLHDMGPDLSDGMPEGDAAAPEWRTPPLWGLGLAARVGGHLFLLHDGRARSVEEAILWHGGEATPSREAFRSMPASARNDLIKFVESL